jgi:hypothetical protein
MLNGKHFLQSVATGAAVAFAACVLVAHSNVPRGWLLAGSKPAEFEVGLDAEQGYQGHASAFLRSKTLGVDGFGTLMQSVRAEQYRGKRVRLSGFVKSQDVGGWAGLWMRVDQGKDIVALDNMQNRSIKGNIGWQRYEVVLDVPQDSTGISFGVLLEGAGEVWLSNTKFDIVGADVPVTGSGGATLPDKPVNLDFTE